MCLFRQHSFTLFCFLMNDKYFLTYHSLYYETTFMLENNGKANSRIKKIKKFATKHYPLLDLPLSANLFKTAWYYYMYILIFVFIYDDITGVLFFHTHWPDKKNCGCIHWASIHVHITPSFLIFIRFFVSHFPCGFTDVREKLHETFILSSGGVNTIYCFQCRMTSRKAPTL